MSSPSQQGEGSRRIGQSRNGQIQQQQQHDSDIEPQHITWSIHASEPRHLEQDQDNGSESSTDGSEDGGTALRQQRDGRSSHALEQDHALRLAHAMTHNPVDALLPSPPQSPPRAVPNSLASLARPISRKRLVTVNDIKNRNCWICSDGDEDDERMQDQNGKARQWVHPCKCTLVAHQDCLVMWIRTRKGQNRQEVIRCPQCSQPYSIIESKPSLLRILERAYNLVSDTTPLAFLGLVGGGILFTATAYGCAALRLWVGKDAAHRVLARKWPGHYYFEIPMIPVTLILSRFKFIDNAMAWLPTMFVYPLFHQNFLGFAYEHRFGRWSTARRPWNARNGLSPASPATWHPAPAMTLLFIPWVRAVYVALRWHVTRRVLRSFSRCRSANDAGSSAQPVGRANADVFGRNLPRLHIVFTNADVPQELDEDGLIPEDENGEPRAVPPGAEAVGANRTTLVSPSSIMRLFVGALGSPLIANVMGKLLARCAWYSKWLRRFLGIEAFATKRANSAAASRMSLYSSSATTSRTPLRNLFATGSIFPDEDASDTRLPSFTDSLDDSHAPHEEWLSDPTFDDLDPVWFRNTLGLGLFIVAKDVVQLTYRYYRLEHARESSRRTKIVDKPFVGGVAEQLELRDPPSSS